MKSASSLVTSAARAPRSCLALLLALAACGRTEPLGGPPVDPARSTVEVDRADGVRADGLDVVHILVTLKDAADRPLDGQQVRITASGDDNTIQQDATTSDGDGHVQATLASLRAELKTITAIVDPDGAALALDQKPTVGFVGAVVDASGSTVVASPTSLVADGVATSNITVTLKDPRGNPVPGKVVQLAATGEGVRIVQPARTDRNGVATGTVASVVAEAKTVTATVDPGGPSALALPQQPTLTFVPGPPSATQSQVAAAPASVPADGVSTTTITVTVKDAQGNPVPGQTVKLSASGAANVFVQPSGPTDARGITTGTLASTKAEVKTITAIVTGPAGGQIVLAQTAQVTFTAGAVSARASILSVSPPVVVANGVAVATVTVTARDTFGNPVPGQAVSLAVSGTRNTVVQPGLTNASGVATGTISSTKAEAKTVSATINPGPGAIALPPASVTFVAGPPDAFKSTISVSPPLLAADGQATATITVTLFDAFGNPVPGATVQVGASGTGNLIAQPARPTDLSGVTTASIASTRAETKLVGAVANPGPNAVLLNQAATVTFVAGRPSATLSTVTAQPARVVADGVATSTITVTVRDAFGNPVPGQTVQLAATGSNNTLVQPPGPTDATGVATGTIASTRAETKTITATVNPGPSQVVIAQQATVTFTGGPPSPTLSTVTASPLLVSADGVATTTVTVTLRDVNGNPVSGAAVQLSATGTQNLFTQPAATNLSGVTTGTLASTRAEVKTITAIANPGLGQVVLAQQPTVTFVPGAPSGTTSTISASPTSVIADGVATSTITVTVRDAGGNPVPGQTVQLAATGSANTLSQPTAVTNASGVATGTLASTRAEVKTISAVINPGPSQVAVAQTASVTFTAGPPSGLTSSLVANPTTVPADGVATSTLIATVRDANGNPVPGQTVRFAATGTGNTLVQPTAVTDAAGVATGTLASTKVEAKTVSGVINPGPSQVAIAQTANVTFTVGAPSAATSTVTVNPSTVVADGIATTTITVTVRDGGGNPVPGVTVQLAATGSANSFAQPAGPTNAAGVTTGTLASTKAEVKTISATLNPGPSQVVVAQQPTVTFVAGPPSATLSTLTTVPSTVVADGTASSTLTATVKDAFGNPVPGQTVRFAASGTGNTLTQPATVTDASGVATGTLASTTVQVDTVTATVNPGPTQVVIAQQAMVTFISGPPSASRSSVTVNPSTVVADGVAFTTITVTVLDVGGNPIPGMVVQLAATGSGNALTQPASPTNASGVTTGSIASTKAEVKTITATVNPGPSQVVLSQKPTVTFVPGPPSASLSTVVANPASLPADGVSTSTITVTVKDAQGNQIPGAAVTLAATGRANTLVQPAATNASGVTTGTLASGQAETKTLTATAAGVTLTQAPTVTFLSGPPAPVPGNNTCAQASSLALEPATGRVALAFFQGNNLYFTQCTANCVTTPVWAAPVVVDTNVATCGRPDGQVSMQFLGPGLPAMAYADVRNGNAKYAVLSGGAWRTSIIGATGGSLVNAVSGTTSLALVGASNTPVVAFHQATSTTQGSVRYATCLSGCTSGTGVTWRIQVVDNQGNSGQYVSLAVDPATKLPRLAYSANLTLFGTPVSLLNYATCANASTTNTCDTARGTWSSSPADGIIGGGQTGRWNSLGIGATGVTEVSYQNASTGQLMMATCSSGCGSATGATWATTTVDAGPNTGFYTALRLDGSDQAHVAYVDSANNRLRYAVQVGSTTTFTIVDVDAPTNPGIPSLLLSPPGTNFAYANGNGMKFYPSSLF